jgi:hypothetical protein
MLDDRETMILRFDMLEDRETIILLTFLTVEDFTFLWLTKKNAIFWDVMQCASCKKQRFGGMFCHHHQGEKNQRTGNNVSNGSYKSHTASHSRTRHFSFLTVVNFFVLMFVALDAVRHMRPTEWRKLGEGSQDLSYSVEQLYSGFTGSFLLLISVITAYIIKISFDSCSKLHLRSLSPNSCVTNPDYHLIWMTFRPFSLD